MSDYEHSINRAERTRTDTKNAGADDEQDEQRSEAEIKRELRKSEVGRAILRRNRELKDRRSGLNGR